MNQSVTQSSHVAPSKSDESTEIGSTPAEKIKDTDLEEVNGGISLPYNPLPYILPV